MSSNTFGTLFKITSFGESHGPLIGCVVDGCPVKFELSEAMIQPFLDKRRPGSSKLTSQRREADKVRIVSGVFEGRTTGAPITLIIENTDARPRDYDAIKDKFRPGHADFTYYHKYGHRDYRGGGRASARETAMRVAAGAIAELYLKQHYNINIDAHLAEVGTVKLDDAPPGALEAEIDAIRREGDSIGARVNVSATAVPIGLGEPVFGKLDAKLAGAMMSIPAVKGVEIGAGFASISMKGSEHRDELDGSGFLSQNSGGMLGGISTGQPIQVSLAVKPTSSIITPAKSLNTEGEEVTVVTKGRHDPCIGIRAVPVARAMMALVLMDSILLYNAYRDKNE